MYTYMYMYKYVCVCVYTYIDTINSISIRLCPCEYGESPLGVPLVNPFSPQIPSGLSLEYPSSTPPVPRQYSSSTPSVPRRTPASALSSTLSSVRRRVPVEHLHY